MNFVIYVLVLTKSFAMILTGPIWPSLAYFLMSATNFCSCFSRFARSRSSSRTALLISRLFFLKTSLSGTFLPQVLPMALAAHGAAQARRNTKPGAALLQEWLRRRSLRSSRYANRFSARLAQRSCPLVYVGLPRA